MQFFPISTSCIIIDFVPINTQFFLLKTCFRNIDFVAETERTGDYLYCLILEQITSDSFLASFTILYSFVMSNDLFYSLLPSRVIKSWAKCNNCILSCLAFDPVYMDNVLNVTKELITIGNPSPKIKRAESDPSSWAKYFD